jgi:hypothetical protein
MQKALASHNPPDPAKEALEEEIARAHGYTRAQWLAVQEHDRWGRIFYQPHTILPLVLLGITGLYYVFHFETTDSVTNSKLFWGFV